MGQLYPEIDDRLRRFVEAQHMFFVATAPVGANGHVNLSPKGLDSFRVLGPREVGYLDYVGSGAETIAHLRENGRIVVMFCALEGAPRIVRMHGRGRVLEPQDAEFAVASGHFKDLPRARALIRISLDRITDSCGYGVPLYRYEGDRAQLEDWAQRKGGEGLVTYQRKNNAHSIDGLPALRWTEVEPSGVKS